jgi:hypothetical protein
MKRNAVRTYVFLHSRAADFFIVIFLTRPFHFRSRASAKAIFKGRNYRARRIQYGCYSVQCAKFAEQFITTEINGLPVTVPHGCRTQHCGMVK